MTGHIQMSARTQMKRSYEADPAAAPAAPACMAAIAVPSEVALELIDQIQCHFAWDGDGC